VSTTIPTLPGLTLHTSFDLSDRSRELSVSVPLHAGRNDLGDVVVPNETATDSDFDVEVRCDGLRLRDDLTFRAFADAKKGKALPIDAWFAGGRHRLRVPRMDGGALLEVQHPDCETTFCVLQGGGSPQVVELQRCAVLRGRVRGAETLAGMGEVAVGGHAGSIEADGSFTVRVGSPGSCDLVVRAGEHVFHEEPALMLHAGLNTWPAGGKPFEVTAASAVFVDIHDAATGRRIDEPNAWLATAGVEDYDDRMLIGIGVHEWLIPPQKDLDLVVAAEGYVPVRVRCPKADVRIELQPAIEIQFVAAVETKFTWRRTDSGAVHPLLRQRALDTGEHEACTPHERREFVPGDVLEVEPIRDGIRGSPQRVVVGATNSQRVEIR
jgi:hypothetical protein